MADNVEHEHELICFQEKSKSITNYDCNSDTEAGTNTWKRMKSLMSLIIGRGS
jgi:hypothetical protein